MNHEAICTRAINLGFRGSKDFFFTKSTHFETFLLFYFFCNDQFCYLKRPQQHKNIVCNNILSKDFNCHGRGQIEIINFHSTPCGTFK